MNLPTTLLLVGLAYTVLFGGLSLMRREGLSAQFAFEATAITVILSGLTALTGFPTHPVFFLAILYLVTMRIRLLVDVGNYLARRGKFSSAEGVYRLAERLWPDRSGRLIIEINRGTLCLQQGALDEAIHTFKSILEKAGQGYLGVKHEAAAHYNLGHAYRRKDMEAQATAEFNAVLDTWPGSEFARRAATILEQSHHKVKPPSSEKDAPDKP